MKLGILGGTFNPVHIAHLRIAEEVRDRYSLDRVIFIPAAVPPHKPAGDIPFRNRFEMVRLAIADNPCFSLSDIEEKRGGKSYSIDTLRALRGQYPEDELYFIIGSDSFVDFGSWREYEAIFACCNIVVVERPGCVMSAPFEALPPAIAAEFCYYEPERQLAHKSGFSVYFKTGVHLDISSRVIRQLVREGRSVRYLVPPAVEGYIKEKRLYSDA